MSKYSTHHFVAAPPARAFDAFTDLHSAPDVVRAIEKLEVLTDGPVGVGTRFRETRRVFKQQATEELEFTVFERPTRYVVEAESCGSAYSTTFRFTPESGGTRVDLDLNLRPISGVAKLMSPLSGVLLETCIKQFEADLEDMSAAAEGRSGR